jgi:hypothetical protein
MRPGREPALTLLLAAAFAGSAALASKPKSKPAIRTTGKVVPVVASKDEQMSVPWASGEEGGQP